VSVTFPVDGLGGGGVEREVEGGVERGGSDGSVMTTVGGGCNKLAIAEFWSKFNADREPRDEGAEPLLPEAAERTPAAPANGEGAVGATAAEPVEVIPGRGAAIDFVMGAVAVGVVSLVGSAVVCMTCPAAPPDISAAGGVWDEVAGAVIEAMAGRLVNGR
jgi:hypothetical protein